MAKTDLSKMTLDQLKALKKDVDAAIDGYEERRRSEVLKEMEDLAAKHGLSIDEVIGGRLGKKKKSRGAVKYRNPQDPKQGWSGRGRQPQWYKDAIASGVSPDKMAV